MTDSLQCLPSKEILGLLVRDCNQTVTSCNKIVVTVADIFVNLRGFMASCVCVDV